MPDASQSPHSCCLIMSRGRRGRITDNAILNTEPHANSFPLRDLFPTFLLTGGEEEKKRELHEESDVACLPIVVYSDNKTYKI